MSHHVEASRFGRRVTRCSALSGTTCGNPTSWLRLAAATRVYVCTVRYGMVLENLFGNCGRAGGTLYRVRGVAGCVMCCTPH